MNTEPLTPQELRATLMHLLEYYEQDFAEGKVGDPHYEQLTVEGVRLKVGYLPHPDETPVALTVRIARKGLTNGS